MAGYTVLSVLGYDMKPCMYSASATRMALAGVKPRELAAVMNSVVLNGIGGLSFLVDVTTSLMTAFFPNLETKVSTSCFSQKRLLTCWTVKSFPFLSLSCAYNSQYDLISKASLSLSLSTISAKVGDWTLPTERNNLPSLPAARDMKRVREAPHTRSMTCREWPASARLKSIFDTFSNASIISLGVIAL